MYSVNIEISIYVYVRCRRFGAAQFISTHIGRLYVILTNYVQCRRFIPSQSSRFQFYYETCWVHFKNERYSSFVFQSL